MPGIAVMVLVVVIKRAYFAVFPLRQQIQHFRPPGFMISHPPEMLWQVMLFFNPGLCLTQY